MFYFRVGIKSKESNRGDEGVRYIGIPQQYSGLPCYFQVYEDGRPLAGLHFATVREARQRLRRLEEELRQASMGWYRVEARNSQYRPIRNIFGIRKIYGDGSSVNQTYVIRKISLRVED